MPFVFDHSPSISVSLQLLKEGHHTIAAVSQYVWDALQLPNHPHTDTYYISISRLIAPSVPSDQFLSSLTCVVNLNNDVRCADPLWYFLSHYFIGVWNA